MRLDRPAPSTRSTGTLCGDSTRSSPRWTTSPRCAPCWSPAPGGRSAAAATSRRPHAATGRRRLPAVRRRPAPHLRPAPTCRCARGRADQRRHRGGRARAGAELRLRPHRPIGADRRRPPQLRADGGRWRAHPAPPSHRPGPGQRAALHGPLPRRRRRRRLGSRDAGRRGRGAARRRSRPAPAPSRPRAPWPSPTRRRCSARCGPATAAWTRAWRTRRAQRRVLPDVVRRAEGLPAFAEKRTPRFEGR